MGWRFGGFRMLGQGAVAFRPDLTRMGWWGTLGLASVLHLVCYVLVPKLFCFVGDRCFGI